MMGFLSDDGSVHLLTPAVHEQKMHIFPPGRMSKISLSIHFTPASYIVTRPNFGYSTENHGLPCVRCCLRCDALCHGSWGKAPNPTLPELCHLSGLLIAQALVVVKSPER